MDQINLGQLLKDKLEGKVTKQAPALNFVFPSGPPEYQTEQVAQDIRQTNIGVVDSIKLFREGTGVTLSEAKWSFDGSFGHRPVRQISALELAMWIRAYYKSKGCA